MFVSLRSVYCLESHMCNCWSRNTTSMAGGTSPGRHGVVCAGIGLVGESRQTRCSVAGIGLVSILCMCKESEYHKYGRRGEYRQTWCSVAGIVLARFMSGNKDRATETYVCVLFYARVKSFSFNINYGKKLVFSQEMTLSKSILDVDHQIPKWHNGNITC